MVIDTAHTFLYLVLGGGKALRYGIGVGRKGFTWSGVERISRKSEWPDWIPPVEMIARQPYLPRWVGGGPGNPLGARALYLGDTNYRIHGTNSPSSIGTQVSSGCIRMRNEDVIDLYRRVGVGTKVVVLAGDRRTARACRRPDEPLALTTGTAAASFVASFGGARCRQRLPICHVQTRPGTTVWRRIAFINNNLGLRIVGGGSRQLFAGVTQPNRPCAV